MTTYQPRTRLGCEALEARDTPAGDVSVALFNGALYLTGDAAANRVHVEQDTVGDIYVVGLDGTSVNGQPAVYAGRGPVSGFFADFGEGEDYLELVGLVAGSVHVHGGNGGDGLYLFNVRSDGDIVVSGDAGNDTLYTTGTLARNGFVIDGGSSFDVWHADNSGGLAGTFIVNVEMQF